MTLYLEDFKVGDSRELGARTITRDEIIAFARQFDPQPFHLDDSSTVYGGIIASGWHTASLTHRMMVDGLVKDGASLGSPGVDELRWLKPVRPGDTLAARAEVTEVAPSRSKADRGTVRFALEVLNQRGERVMTFRGAGIFLRRP